MSNQQKPPYGMIAILFVGAFVSFLNNTLMNVALPTIMTDFDVTYSQVQWLSTGYMLVSGVLIPASAFFVVRFKNRHLFIAAMSIFTIGTIIAAAAPNFSVLIAGRMVQAAGSAAMSPLLMNVMLVSFPAEKRGSAMGIFGLVMIAAPAIGPTLSGYIVEHHSWRMLFEMIIPFAVLSLLFGIWKLKNVMDTRKVSLDYLSLVFSTIGFGGLLYGFSSAGDKGWGDPLVYGTITIGAIALIIFIFKQLRMEEPLLDLRIYKYPMFALASIISAVVSVAMFSGMILTPAYVQQVRGISPFHAGLMMLPGAIVMAFMSPITGKLFDKFGPRILAFIGLTITTVATYFLTKLEVDSSYTYIITVYTVRMFGMSMVMMPIMTNGLNSLPMLKNPHGTAINNTVQQVSGAIGTAILVTVMNNHIKSSATELAAEAKAKAVKAAKKAAEAGITPSSPTAEQLAKLKAQITQTALLDGINYTFMVATIISAVALVLSIFLKRVRVDKINKPEMEQK
ncbi:DHA2 family efflux MFS transporter permease subunit [Rummeliibacillus sp. TYF-LIM-RU47]|uniref:DHA2 family efflux MFS transporter permease subunit n=1 Tax=unclassified Rummeliibacillus TaxID=2622809 RepID=UPI0012397944|nr:DHA2 family efflux MFS transporter permease subunit [Rummeliibacillus sp. TYF-LIM-RU47]